jgi:hypothetical protein
MLIRCAPVSLMLIISILRQGCIVYQRVMGTKLEARCFIIKCYRKIVSKYGFGFTV